MKRLPYFETRCVSSLSDHEKERLLQLVAQAVLFGSGNMADSEVREMERLSGYKRKPQKRGRKPKSILDQ